jgi:hypothetical protein
MKRILFCIFILGVSLVASCSTTPNSTENIAIRGKWLADYSEVETKEGDEGIWDFSTNTRLDWINIKDGNKEVVTNKYYIEGNKLIIMADNNPNIKSEWYFDLITPNRLRIKLPFEVFKTFSKIDMDMNSYILDWVGESVKPFIWYWNRFEVDVNEFKTLEKADKIETALENAAKAIIASIPKGRNIAISNISVEDIAQSDFIAKELEFILLKAGYVVVDRSHLDVIRQEQNLQLSGEVNDEQIISIGNFLGANTVITSSIDGSGPTRRLRLRLLDIETARVIAAASERF